MTAPRLLLVLALLMLWASPAPARTLLLGAWTPDEAGLLTAAGLPVGQARPWELRTLDRVGQRANLGFALLALDGREIATALREGRIQFAVPARAGADPRLLYSDPIGERRELLFLPRGFPAADAPLPALRMAVRAGLRIAVARPELLSVANDRGLASLAGNEGLLFFPSDAQAIRAALEGQADAAIVEANAGLAALVTAPPGSRPLVPRLRPIARSAEVIAFAPDTDPAVLARVNAAIAQLAPEAAAFRLRESRSVMLRHTLDSIPAFRWLDAVGLVAFALSGVLIARRDGWSLFGGLVLALLPALGGGVLRDLLVGRRPLYVLEGPGPLLTVLGVVLAGWLVFRLVDWARGRLVWMIDLANLLVWLRGRRAAALPLEVTDAAGLAAFTVTGVLVAVRFNAEPLWLWGPLLAALTGAGGGILRDVVRSDPGIAALRTAFYAEVCLIWGLGLSLGLLWLGEEASPRNLTLLVVATMAGVFATRLVAWTSEWRSPSFRRG